MNAKKRSRGGIRFRAGIIAGFAAAVAIGSLAPTEEAAAQFLDATWTATKTAVPSQYDRAGQVINYSIAITNTGPISIVNVVVTDPSLGATLSCPGGPFPTIAPGATLVCTGYRATTAADVANGSYTNTATVQGEPVTVANGPPTLNPSATISLTAPTIDAVRLTYAEPDRARIFRRIPGSLWGDGTTTANGAANDAVSFSGHTSADASQLNFATSLQQVSQAVHNATDIGSTGPIDNRFDIWVEGQYSAIDRSVGAINVSGGFGVLFAGIDYLLTDAVLVGALVQVDWLHESGVRGVASKFDGTGFMVGPYFSTQILPNLFFDARFAWGTSDNSVTLGGNLVTGKFSTERWLAAFNLTGNWTRGDFRFTPNAALVFVEERQGAYLDSLGRVVPARVASLGRLEFGPEIAYRHVTSEGTVVEPFVSLHGLWDFNTPSVVTVGNIVSGGQEFSAVAKAGVQVTSPLGINVKAVASYSGIGAAGFESIGGQLWVNIPLGALQQ